MRSIQKQIKSKESTLGVFEETAPLKKVLMWGAPGVEAILGQLLPKKISLFKIQFNVPRARKEFTNVKALLEAEGVEVILVKDLFARMIKDKAQRPKTGIDDLKRNIETKAYSYNKQYGCRSIVDFDEILSWVDDVLKADVKKYGEDVAVLINEELALNNELPLSNVLYARDQSNLLGLTWIWSSMRHIIRQPEVHLFKTSINETGFFKQDKISQIQVSGNGMFEGGDAIANGGIFYMGVGGRTNLAGVRQIAEPILTSGGRVMIPIDKERDLGTKSEMDAMHLDTIWMPVSENEIVACTEEIEQRKLLEIVNDPNRGLIFIDRGWFVDHLEKRNVKLIPLTKKEQEKYAPNFLNLGKGRVVLSLAEGNNLTKELGKRKIKVFNANLQEITKGFGGLHCMTASIKRG